MKKLKLICGNCGKNITINLHGDVADNIRVTSCIDCPASERKKIYDKHREKYLKEKTVTTEDGQELKVSIKKIKAYPKV